MSGRKRIKPLPPRLTPRVGASHQPSALHLLWGTTRVIPWFAVPPLTRCRCLCTRSSRCPLVCQGSLSVSIGLELPTAAQTTSVTATRAEVHLQPAPQRSRRLPLPASQGPPLQLLWGTTRVTPWFAVPHSTRNPDRLQQSRWIIVPVFTGQAPRLKPSQAARLPRGQSNRIVALRVFHGKPHDDKIFSRTHKKTSATCTSRAELVQIKTSFSRTHKKTSATCTSRAELVQIETSRESLTYNAAADTHMPRNKSHMLATSWKVFDTHKRLYMAGKLLCPPPVGKGLPRVLPTLGNSPGLKSDGNSLKVPDTHTTWMQCMLDTTWTHTQVHARTYDRLKVSDTHTHTHTS